jgi:NADH-quinone oxidoreductase subunit C
MSERVESLVALIEKRLAGRMTRVVARVGEVTVDVDAAHLVAVCTDLRDHADLRFGQLVDLCGVDYLHYGQAEWETSEQASSEGFSRGVQSRASSDPVTGSDRFAVIYHLLSHDHNRRLRLRCVAAGDPPRVPSLVGVWPSADWYEREAFDLYGILFEGHPDLRRILTDYGFIGHPFRKDFPLSGHVETRYDPDKGRVVYEPVSIEPRVLVPKVIRHDERYTEE